MRVARLHILAVSVSLLTGCATHELPPVQGDQVLFTASPVDAPWRLRYWDYGQIARDFAKSKRFDFKREDYSAVLSIYQGDGALLVRVTIWGDFGSPMLCVEMDTHGKVLRYYKGITECGGSHIPGEKPPPPPPWQSP
jgi:hypothetical protein